MQEKFLNLIKDNILTFNNELINNTKTNIKDFEPVLSYIHESTGKQIRAKLGIVLAKNLTNTFNKEQELFLQGIELIHNATLFHDDVIDNAKTRRNRASLQEKFSNKLAILSGDYFLSVAIQNIIKLNNMQINHLLSDYMKLICEGEIEQNYSLNKIISLEEYIEKTRKKTALLFKLTTTGIVLLSDNCKEEILEIASNIGENFGILFQLDDDLNNYINKKDKPILNDLKDGVITAPIIFLAEECNELNKLIETKNYDEILNKLNSSKAIYKTKKLIENYHNKVLNSMNLLPDNIFKEALIDLLSEFGY